MQSSYFFITVVQSSDNFGRLSPWEDLAPLEFIFFKEIEIFNTTLIKKRKDFDPDTKSSKKLNPYSPEHYIAITSIDLKLDKILTRTQNNTGSGSAGQQLPWQL